MNSKKKSKNIFFIWINSKKIGTCITIIVSIKGSYSLLLHLALQITIKSSILIFKIDLLMFNNAKSQVKFSKIRLPEPWLQLQISDGVERGDYILDD